MILLGLAGHAGSGKDTIADYLVERYGFIKFSFSDALYREVAEAFNLDATIDDSDDAPGTPQGEWILRDRATKDTPTDLLRIDQCNDFDFVKIVTAPGRIPETVQYLASFCQPLSPRQILQWWGTQYRRAQSQDYWIDRADEWVTAMAGLSPYAETRPQFYVNTSVRFPNEREWIGSYAPFGSIWHVHRDGIQPVNPHESETPLPVLEGEREIWNNHTIEYLHMGIDQLMSSNIPSIRIEPPEPMAEPMRPPKDLPGPLDGPMAHVFAGD